MSIPSEPTYSLDSSICLTTNIIPSHKPIVSIPHLCQTILKHTMGHLRSAHMCTNNTRRRQCVLLWLTYLPCKAVFESMYYESQTLIKSFSCAHSSVSVSDRLDVSLSMDNGVVCKFWTFPSKCDRNSDVCFDVQLSPRYRMHLLTQNQMFLSVFFSQHSMYTRAGVVNILILFSAVAGEPMHLAG